MSTETMESVGVATFTEIVEQMDFHLECEHGLHDEAESHEGDAAWHAVLKCTRCDGNTGSFLVCDKWVKYMQTETAAAYCAACNTEIPIDEWLPEQTFTKI